MCGPDTQHIGIFPRGKRIKERGDNWKSQTLQVYQAVCHDLSSQRLWQNQGKLHKPGSVRQ